MLVGGRFTSSATGGGTEDLYLPPRVMERKIYIFRYDLGLLWLEHDRRERGQGQFE